MATFDGSDDLDAEQTPVFDKMNKEYKIYADNLPQELNEDAIRQVFSPYGKITGMFYRPNATWTYITYGSYREAELAIRELNNKKPLYLKVALAKTRPLQPVNEKFERNLNSTGIEETPYITEPVFIQNTKHIPQSMGRGYTIRKCVTMPDPIVPHKYVPHHERLESLSPLPTMSSAYGHDDPYMSTNKLWTRGMLTITADGKRHVSLGRGYSMYEIPESDPRCEDYITQVYELRKNGLYEYADDKFKNELRKCIVCSTKTTKHCEKCYTYYCSKACQVTHWPRHQVECERIPDLVDENSSEQVVINETTKPQSPNDTPVSVNTFSDVKLRRPNTPVQIKNLSINMQQKSCTDQTNENAKTDKCPNNQLDNKDNVPKEKIVSQPAVDATSNRISQNHSNRYNSNEDIVDQTKKNDQFSTTANHTRHNYSRGYKNDFTNKTCSDKEINKNSHVKDKFNNVNRGHSNHQRDAFQKDTKPSYNQRETITNKGQRSSMLSMDAEKTMAVEVKERSNNVVTHPIKDPSLLNVSSNTSNSTMKALQEKSSPNEKTPTTQLGNILNVFANSLTEHAVSELTVSGIIQIFEHTQKNVYTATLIPDDLTSDMNKIINDLPAVCGQMVEANSNYKPEVGDLVCSETENGIWYRGYITSSSPDLRVAVVDEARILPAIRALPCPKEFLNICTYGVTCKIANVELQAGEVYSFTGIVKEDDIKQGSFKIKIKKDNEFVEAMIKPWQHITKSVPALAELRNGSKICLTSYRNQYIMFAHSLDESEVEYAIDIVQRIANYSLKAPYLSKPPNIEQMVIAPYVDGNRYRAMITKVQDSTATIVYVDFGNFIEINVNELQEIPDDLAFQRSCSAKLFLKDVPRNMAMTAEVDTYLRDLVGREETLVCTYDNGSFKNGVHLTTTTGESVNNKIKELLIPCWKKDNYDDKTCYMLHDISIAPIGKVGDTVEALILHLSDIKKLLYMMVSFDHDLILHVIHEMPKLIQEYCEKTEYYIPRKQELCLALYDGSWYRGLCLDPQGSSTKCEVFFIDFGNIDLVEHKNIRQMPETFIRPAAMANICTVVNLAPVDNAGNYSAAIQKRVSELVVINTTVEIKIIEFIQSGEYKIELPKIRATLEQEGLVPSSF